MNDTNSIIVSNIKFCMRELNNLVIYERPKYPDNSEIKWELFKNEMKKTVIFFRNFIVNVRSVVNLRSAKNSLEKADKYPKQWAGRHPVLYNPTQGELLPVLLHCKEIIEYLLKHLSLMSEKIQENVKNSQEILTELYKHKLSDLHELNLMELKPQVDIQTLLCQMKDLNDN